MHACMGEGHSCLLLGVMDVNFCLSQANCHKMNLDDGAFALTDLPFLPIESMRRPSSYGQDGLRTPPSPTSVEIEEVHSEGMHLVALTLTVSTHPTQVTESERSCSSAVMHLTPEPGTQFKSWGHWETNIDLAARVQQLGVFRFTSCGPHEKK